MATLTSSQNELWRTLLSGGAYKPTQGQYARYATLGALLILVGLGIYSWSLLYTNANPVMKWAIPLPVGLVLAWVCYRLIHFPRFADFLISTESEMAKVKWPSWSELRAATAVILINVIVMAVFLFATDLFWRFLLNWLGILSIPQFFGGGMGM